MYGNEAEVAAGIDALYARLAPKLERLAQGRVRPPFDRAYGMREFHVKDPDGCLLLFGEPISCSS